MLALLSMGLTREHHDETVPLLSCRNIQELLAWSLPDRRSNPKELMRLMADRHRRRQDAIEKYLC
jgi:hypothetical protein